MMRPVKRKLGCHDGRDGGYRRVDHSRNVRQLDYGPSECGGDPGDDQPSHLDLRITFPRSNHGPDSFPLHDHSSKRHSFPAGQISKSEWVYYTVPWNSYIHALRADAKTNNDILANASLPVNCGGGTPTPTPTVTPTPTPPCGALSTNIYPTSAGGRAVGLNTRPAMFPNGTVGPGGQFDGIVTLNSAAAFQFSRPPNGNNFDAQYFTEHEIDEVIGLGSFKYPGIPLRPQDLFSWFSRGVRNTTSISVRYFSINGGSTNIVNFNQNPNFDFGDWLSRPCPQAHPFVQNAFGCPGQFSDVTATSPEGVNLDVIGYDLASSPTTDVNGDGKPDFLLYNTNTRGTAAWYMNNNVFIEGAFGPALPAGWILVSAADFNRDGLPDYALFKPNTRQTVVWYFSGVTRIGSASGPTPPSGWALVATGDFNNEVKPDYVLYNSSTRQTVVWFMNNNVRVGGAIGPTLPAGWSVAGVADFNGDGKSDYLLFNPTTRQTVIWYLSGTTRIGSAVGPTIAAG